MLSTHRLRIQNARKKPAAGSEGVTGAQNVCPGAAPVRIPHPMIGRGQGVG